MTAMPLPAEIPREESYSEFVRRKFPDDLHRIEGLPDLKDDTLWASLENDPGPRLFGDSRQITIVDFQTVPRKFVFKLTHSRVSWKSDVHEMMDCIRKVTPSQGILILWEYTLRWPDSSYRRQRISSAPRTEILIEDLLVAALAEASFAHPVNISNLWRCWRAREKRSRDTGDMSHWIQPTEIPEYSVQMVERLFRSTSFSELNYLSNTRHRLLSLQKRHILDLSSCRDTSLDQASAYLVFRKFHGDSIPDDLVNQAVSHSSPEAFIASTITLEVQTMLDASVQIVDKATGSEMNSDVYRASCCLQELSKTLNGELQPLGDTTNNPLIPSGIFNMALNLEKELERFEPYVKEAYQLFIDSETLKGTRKSIEMAEISIEMSKKSIKESERVRVLTIIALIFLPISLASSIFGMNVTIIDSEKTPFFAFIVTAVGLFFGALLIWAGSSIFVRYQKINQALRRRDKHNKVFEQLAMLRIANTRKFKLRTAMISWWTQRDADEVLYEASVLHLTNLRAFRGT